jgi:hypothetical protein
MRVMLHTPWSGEQWSVVMTEFRKALALRSETMCGVIQLGRLRGDNGGRIEEPIGN